MNDGISATSVRGGIALEAMLAAPPTGDREALLAALAAAISDITGMLESYVQWAQHWHAWIIEREPGAVAQRIRGEAQARWQLWLEHEGESADLRDETELAARIAELAAAMRVPPEHLEDLGADRRTWVHRARTLHDACVALIDCYGAAVLAHFGQPALEQAMLETIAACDFYEDFWTRVAAASPAELVDLIVAEFVGHFSGPERSGLVQVVEGDASYQVIFDPCGSGGAYRRSRPEEAPASMVVASTWGTTAVPPYCLHCAQNEEISMRRLGYRAWRTAFVADPERPCGWTILKHPETTGRNSDDRDVRLG